MVNDWDGRPIPFNGTVRYRCVDGTFFADIRDKGWDDVTCLSDGTMLSASNVPCVTSLNCTEDPPVRAVGSLRHWSGSYAFDTLSTYVAAPFRRFVDPVRPSILTTEIESICLWNQTWSKNQTDILETEATHCLYIPSPPPSSGLIIKEDPYKNPPLYAFKGESSD